MRQRAALLGLLTALGLGCTGQTHIVEDTSKKTEAPKKDVVTEAPTAKEPKEAPPPSLPPRPFVAPKITWAELSNGLKIASRVDRAVPIVHLRLAAIAGSSVDGEKTGLASVCAKAIASSGTGSTSDFDVRTKLETLGATLSVNVDGDRVVYGLSVQRDWLDEALGWVSRVVMKPALGEKDILLIKQKAMEDAASNAREDGRWDAYMVLQKALFVLPSEQHPYAAYDATKTQIEAIKPADCKDYHRRYFVPKNLLVAASGDVKAEEVRAVVDKHFGKLRGGEAPTVSFADPMPPESTKITLVDRPGSTQSEVLVGTLGPKQEEPGYAHFLVAKQVLGGAFTGRLSTDVREKRGLAYLTSASVWTFASGPSMFYAYAQTQNESTGAALGALLDHLRSLATNAPTEGEVEIASRYLAAERAVDNGMPGRSADEIVDLWAQRLPDEWPDGLSRAVREATPQSVSKVFAEYVRAGHGVIVVTGDASAVGPLLQPYGEVKVVDPTQDFQRVRTLPAKP